MLVVAQHRRAVCVLCTGRSKDAPSTGRSKDAPPGPKGVISFGVKMSVPGFGLVLINECLLQNLYR